MWQKILKQNRISNIVIRGDETTAMFLDNKSDEKLKMSVSIHDESLDANIIDKEGRQITRAYAEKIDDDTFQAKDVRTDSRFMRRGYGENLYHLIAYALDNQGYNFVPDDAQSGEMLQMWDKNTSYGSWDIPDYM
ncbi:MAG: hypothetical protein GOVbin4206_88 [Prokaryotic dsDNA virus sp.]|nr:MAG: hypothetical protein GOVbin4206_88 [Prokaryotic dsDNA virus sp.]|tara:strand:+ start:539 stop:943 length:405 start_codon:yes stop_codon:yes gene_type:complete